MNGLKTIESFIGRCPLICVYAPDCTDFSTNGLGPVSP